jgi:hypothetical protein
MRGGGVRQKSGVTREVAGGPEGSGDLEPAEESLSKRKRNGLRIMLHVAEVWLSPYMVPTVP